MYTLVGIERKRGEGKNERGEVFSWDNYNFYLLENLGAQNESLVDDGDIIGQRVIVEKVRVAEFEGELPVVGAVYEIYYNKRGKVSKFVPA